MLHLLYPFHRSNSLHSLELPSESFSSYHSHTTPAPSASCTDFENWRDSYGDGCEWYEENDSEGCPNYGDYWNGGMGTANEACCWCGGGNQYTAPPVTPGPVSLAPTDSPSKAPTTLIISTIPTASPTEIPTTAPVTLSPVTSAPITPVPVTPAPVTSAPVTSSPITSAPVTPAPITSVPITPAPITPAPVTPAPISFDCSIYDKKKGRCNNQEGCSFVQSGRKCKAALSTSECSEFNSSKRICRRMGCIYRKSLKTCIGRWS